jgi:hypothetical protein
VQDSSISFLFNSPPRRLVMGHIPCCREPRKGLHENSILAGCSNANFRVGNLESMPVRRRGSVLHESKPSFHADSQRTAHVTPQFDIPQARKMLITSKLMPFRPSSSTLGPKILKRAAYRFFSDCVFTIEVQSNESHRCLVHSGLRVVAGQTSRSR